MTPADLRAKARELDAAADAALARGDATAMAVAIHQANTCRLAADELERLAGGKPVDETLHVDDNRDMTASQLARRGRAVARTRADNALMVAICADKRWGSSAVYAKKRLGVHPSSLTRYMSGEVPPPQEVAKKVATDFPGIAWTWPKTPVL